MCRYDGSLYEGFWKEDKLQYRGRVIYANGEYYYGDFDRGIYHGDGVKQFADGKHYEGQFSRGYP